jgi:arylsulfatase A-like enzyme
MKNRNLTIIFTLIFCYTSFLFAQERPNIIVILADDLGYNDLGYTGSKDILTPQIDKLAKNGMICTNGYVTHPYCGPSRAGLITGRYQARFGFEINPTYSPYDLYMGLPLEEKTFAKRLQEAGYRTGVVGKWHLGAAPPYHPNNRGFNHFYGFLSGGHDYFPNSVNSTRPLINNNGDVSYSVNEGGYLPLVLNNNYGEFNEYLTTALSRNAASFVKKSDEKPFMLYLAYNAPHLPLQAPEETIKKYSHIKNQSRRVYAAMIDEMDSGIGMVIDALKETGKLENTIIFFLSDNGGVLNSKYVKDTIGSNYPFKDGKGSMYEGGCHVPFFVHWPKGIKNPKKFNGLVSALDIAATALSVGNADTSDANLDGVDLTPYLTNQRNDSPHNALFWRMNEGTGWSVRTEKFKFLLNNMKASPELYDMIKDPYESLNIITPNSNERKALAKLWNDWNYNNKNITWLQANDYQKKRIELYKKLNLELKKKASLRPGIKIE